jgi:ubiquinone/menaquinone biosynthesis C-methylase UbiE
MAMISPEKVKKRRMKYLLGLLRQKKGGKILDIGCQEGELCYQLSQMGYDPYGVEIMEGLINAARGKYPHIKFKLADCEKNIPFNDKFFDIVWAGDVIEHIRFTDTFINEVNRVLKPGGVFVLTAPVHNRVKNIIISLCNFESHFNPEFPHLRFYTVKSLKSVLGKRGFKILSVNYIGRIRPISCSMFVQAEKIEDKEVDSVHRY